MTPAGRAAYAEAWNDLRIKIGHEFWDKLEATDPSMIKAFRTGFEHGWDRGAEIAAGFAVDECLRRLVGIDLDNRPPIGENTDA